ncbi:hypothetical protein [Streptomyces sp. AC495_CC817]|uniref:hypothetical protein n=1 Tax=Streptomyces sp. AC495_CC817 TaxID=2823900 RepID=UPI001C27E07E|nr:hypothetical protein [Streptomyces sp. AC495_CC817]
MADHTERVTITDALGWDCVEGECEHSDEADMNDFEHCPKITIEVCVACMEERGHGRDQRFWEELISHTDPPKPTSEREPAIFKPGIEVVR